MTAWYRFADSPVYTTATATATITITACGEQQTHTVVTGK
jgi:hypothetical protein